MMDRRGFLKNATLERCLFDGFQGGFGVGR